MGYIGMAKATFGETDKPYAMLSNLSSGIDRGDVQLLEEDGIPVLEGTLTGLAAFRHLFAHRDHARAPEARGHARRSRPGSAIAGASALRTRRRSGSRRASRSSRTGACRSSTAASRRARPRPWTRPTRIGYPVVVKTAMRGIVHKSDVGGVRLGLRDPAAVVEAYEALATSLGPAVVVAPMAPPGVEINLGIVRDPQFGPLVLVAAGGVLVEVLHDRRLALPPLDEARARRLVDRPDGAAAPGRGARPTGRRRRRARPRRRRDVVARPRPGRPHRRHRREPPDLFTERLRRRRRARDAARARGGRLDELGRIRRRAGRPARVVVAGELPGGAVAVGHLRDRAGVPSRGFLAKSKTCSKAWVRSMRGVRYGRPQLSSMNRSGVENSPSASST